MPEWLTRKVGPLPIWGYALGGVALFFLYRRGKAASSSTASTTGATSNISASVPDIPTASITTPGGFSYTGPLGGLNSLIPTGALSATSGSNSGSGVSSFLPLSAHQAYNLSMTNPQSTSIFYQSAPGVFTNVPIQSFNPSGALGTAYELVPSNYTAPQGSQSPVTGVIGGA